MSTAAPTKPPGYAIKNCEVFQAGTHRGEVYTEADLDAMARNFAAARGTIDPPLVVGHEEHQPLAEGTGLDNTGIPAMGWVSRVWRQGSKLFADFAGVPKLLADAIRNRLYRKVSAEIYDEPPEGSPPGCKGKMLRRVALLGGELPQVKSLADLPGPEQFGERRGGDLRPRGGAWQTGPALTGWRLTGAATSTRRGKLLQTFSEAQPMDREAMTTALLAAGWSQEEIDAIKDDAALGVIVAHTMQGAAPVEAAEPGEAAPAVTDNADMPTPDQMIADLVALGMDQAQLQAMSPEDLMALWQEKKGTTMAATQPAAVVTRPVEPTAPAPAAPKQVTYKFAEDRLNAIEVRFARAEQMSAKRLADEKLASVKAFCERMKAAGKLLPAEEEAGMVDFAMSLDAVAVRKFSDGKSGTQLDRWMAQIEARPELVKFGERLKQPKAGAGDEAAKVRRFSEQPGFARTLAAIGKKPEQYVAEFEELKKKRPALTAAEYGVPADFAA